MHLGKKTKIVCTIGPATQSVEQLEKLLHAGMNVVRMNFSHGDFAEHQNKVNNARTASKNTGIPVALLQDLSGPKIRIGTFGNNPDMRVTLKAGQKIVLTTDEKTIGSEKKVYVNYPKLPKEVKKGEAVLLDDGKIRLECVSVVGKEVTCKIINGGEVKGRRGVNLPESELSISALTDKDKKDIEFGIKNDVDFVAFSFVRKRSEAEELRAILNKKGAGHIAIIAKIETPQALKNFDDILEVVDGIMVARGDLAVEIPAEDVPLAQKMMIKKCNEAGKPVITATQMLESMIKSPVPTRAEVSDVANAILDGTDALMLSEETTLGEYPIKAVEVMTRVSARVENDLLHHQLLSGTAHQSAVWSTGSATCASAVRTAERVGAKYIIALTEYGYGARMTARHRGPKPILVLTPNKTAYQQSILLFGCYPIMIEKYKTFESALDTIKPHLVKEKLVKKGDKVVIVSGVPFRQVRESNIVTVETL